MSVATDWIASTWQINDLVEDNEGDKAVVKDVFPDGKVKVIWDCTGKVTATPFAPYGFTNLSARVRELSA